METIDETRRVLRHFLAALAYRTQKALRGAPPEFADFSAGSGTRTPRELVRHMASVLGYARTFFIGGVYQPHPLDSMEAEVERFHANVGELAEHLASGTPLRDLTYDQLLQGPFSDAMTHAGQIAMLRRLAGSPVESENFLFADISADRLGSDQALPAAPDAPWMGRVVQLAWRFARWQARWKNRGR
ncbi:MAG TPA: hypothetical protein VFJ16_11110 [Longimicrobium sp.]|nr:hypothetical protein [Longimicrobium sp.]